MKVIKFAEIFPFLTFGYYEPERIFSLISALTDRPFCLSDIIFSCECISMDGIQTIMSVLGSKRILFWHDIYEWGHTRTVIFENSDGDYVHLDMSAETVSIKIFSNRNFLKDLYEARINQLSQLIGSDNHEYIRVIWRCCISNGDRDPLRLTMKLHKNYEAGIPVSNYTQDTREQILRLEEFLINDNYYGRVVVFEGPPGTGKSYYVRRLVSRLYQSKKIDKIHYYLGDGVRALDIVACLNPNLLIFEDADHILRKDTDRSCDLTKILNFSSGFVDTQALFVFTTNLELKDMDPALVRDGRLLARIRFNTFTKKEAQTWLLQQGCETKLNEEEYTLANLYALLRNFKRIGKDTKPAGVGFRIPNPHPVELVEDIY